MASVSMKFNKYDPDQLTVQKGEKVTWTNDDAAPTRHTVTSDDGKFNSGDVASGKTFLYTFAEAGTYRYHCNHHGPMKGTVTVKP